MRIGIDIDDTITDSKTTFMKYKKMVYPDRNPENLLSHKEYEDFVDKYLSEIYESVSIKPNADKCIKELKDLGCEIVIITLRANEPKLIESTKKNLKKNNIIYDDIYFEVLDKGALANKLNLDLFIDDRLLTCHQMKENNINVIKFKRNDEYKEDFIEFDNWLDILNYIKEDLWTE